MKHTDELKKFLAEYEQYKIKVLKPTHDKLKIILRSWENPEYWGKYTTGKGVATPSPIRMTMIRIKHPEMEVGVQCALTELYPILKTLSSRGINTIGDLLKNAIPRRLVTIRNTYISTTEHAPDNLELISALAALKGALTKEIEIERVKSQIDYHQSKIHFKKEFKSPPNIENE